MAINKEQAGAIIETLIEAMKPGTQREALAEVLEFINNTHEDITEKTPEQRKELIKEYLTNWRDRSTETERREQALFWLDGLPLYKIAP